MPKKQTLSVRLLARARRKARRERTLLPARHGRPKTRADCVDAPRPCPYVGCRHHLFLEVTPRGSLQLPLGDDVARLEQMAATCSLDVADDGGETMLEVAGHVHLTQYAARLVYNTALMQLGSTRMVQELCGDGRRVADRQTNTGLPFVPAADRKGGPS